MRTNLLVVDDFYPNADQIRQKALDLNFARDPEAKYPGVSAPTFQNTIPLLQDMKRLLNIANMRWDVAQGDFRVATEKDRSRKTTVHTDMTRWSGVVYLTPDVKGVGTFFYQHKTTGWKRLYPPDHEKTKLLMDCLGLKSANDVYSYFAEQTNDLEKWDVIQTIDQQYNRLVLFNGWYFHSSTIEFTGESLETGRLSQHFFFNDSVLTGLAGYT